ncbi:MAG: hypothetical protein ABI779_09210 [Acidobacteriota bacterium]
MSLEFLRCTLITALAIVAFSETSAFGERKEFVGVAEGKRVVGSEACFFPATQDDGFFKKFLSSADVRCLSADAVIQMPPGNWNVFLENGNSFTSIHPIFQFGDGESEIASRAYSQIEVVMRPAAVVRFDHTSIDDGTRGVVYFPNIGVHNHPSTIRPLRSGKSSLLVPASTPVVPLLVRGTDIVAVGDILTLAPGTTVTATFRKPPEGRRDVVALLRIVGDIDEADALSDELIVNIDSGAALIGPAFPLRNGLEIDRSLAIFRNVPADPVSIVVRGRRWPSLRIPILATSRAVDQLADPVRLIRRAEVEARWTRPSSVDQTEPCQGSEATPRRQSEGTRIGLELCVAGSPCAPVKEVAVDASADHGRVVFSDLPAARYRVVLRDPFLGEDARELEAKRGVVTEASVALSPIVIRGAVTRGGAAVRATVEFSTGVATTDQNGRYEALLRSPPGRNTVQVIPCDGTAHYTSVRQGLLIDGDTYDIALPDNRVKVTVSEEDGRTPIEGAKVYAVVLLERGGDDWFSMDAEPTRKEGTSTLSQVTPEAWLRICAHRSGFKGRCSAEFTLAGDETKEVRLDLTRSHPGEGRVVAAAPIIGGRLYWVSPSGVITERNDLGDDGRFRYEIDHPQDYLILVSRSHALNIFRAPVTMMAANSLLEIALPPNPGREIRIVPRAVTNARIAIEVDGLMIPTEALTRHLGMRNEDWAVRDGRPLRVPGIVGQTLAVLVGPPANFRPPGAPMDGDWADLPQFRALFRRVPMSGDVLELN